MLYLKKSIKIKTIILLALFIFLALSLVTVISAYLPGTVSVVEASGTQSLSNLSVGDIVVDKSWVWDHRTGPNYEDWFGGVTQPVTWIVVAKDHYSGGDRGSVGESHVTLQTEKIIARVNFDNSTNRGHASGSNRWDDSGKPNATFGARTFLNNDFYNALSPEFKAVLLDTTLPNKVYNTGAEYPTKDKIFLPSSTELGDSLHQSKHVVGADWGYYTDNASRIAKVDEQSFSGIVQVPWPYWTRSAYDRYSFETVFVQATGEISPQHSSESYTGLRPALNLKSGTQVSETKNADGAYELLLDVPPDSMPPATPVLLSPVHGKIVHGSSVELNWAPAAGATHYTVWVYNLTKGEELIFSAPTAETFYTLGGLADNGDNYAWSVIGLNANDNTAGEFATPIAFINGSDADLLPPTLASPAHSANVSGTSVEFSWEASAGATLYSVWLFNLTTNEQVIQTVPSLETSYTFTGLSNNGDLYAWSVIASDSYDWSDYAFPRLFVNE